MRYLTQAVIAASLLGAIVIRLLLKRRRPPLPPGPPADPLLGHLRHMPDRNEMDEVFHQWSLVYGEVFSLQILGKIIVVLNSEKAAYDLLEKKSGQYSDRPPFPIFDRIGWKGGLLFSRYGTEEFNYQRKMCNLALQKNAIPAYKDYQREEIDTMLKGLLDRPKDLGLVLHRTAVGIILAAVYGFRVKSFGDPFIGIADDINYVVAGSSRSSLLDVSSFFAFLPKFFPGAWFVRWIKDAAPIMHKIIHLPYEKSLRAMSSGEVPPSFVQRQLQSMAEDGRDSADAHRLLRLAASQMVAGGTETTWDSMSFFVICMMQNPHAQKRAQEEIDKMVGRDRLPELADRPMLPYVECVMQETLRYQPALPQGFPHANMADDCYNGMFIPKGAIVIANTRSITRNEENFHEPNVFKPERFLPEPEGAGEKFPMNAVFGWGRRLCPGRHLAEANLWLTFARILAAFDISPPTDRHGHPIEQTIRFRTGISRHPEPFLCDITPRDDKARSLVEESYAQHQEL